MILFLYWSKLSEYACYQLFFTFWYPADDELEQLKRKNKELEVNLSFYKQMYETGHCAPLEETKSTSTLLNEIAPSSVKWDMLLQSGIMPSFLFFLETCRSLQSDISSIPNAEKDSTSLLANKSIQDNSSPINEGLATLIWGNYFAALTQLMNQGKSTREYTFLVFPVIKENLPDHRRNLKCDYTLIKFHNSRTLIVCELKIVVGVELTSSDKDGLAQLLYEVKLASDADPAHNTILAIYASHNVAHILRVKTNTIPYTILMYQKIVLNESSDVVSLLKSLLD